MSGTRKLAILGTGGTCLDILDTITDLNGVGGAVRYECVAFFDDNRALWGSTLQGVPVRGPLAAAAELRDCYYANGIGSPGNFWRKPQILDATGVPLDRFVTLVHPSASVSRTARLGAGVVIFPHVTVASNARIGNHVVVLANSVISHDDAVGDFTCIAGGVCLSGNVHVGRACYLGTRSAVIGGVGIGDGALVGMGSVVLRSVAPNTVVAGNPARVLRVVEPPAADGEPASPEATLTRP